MLPTTRAVLCRTAPLLATTSPRSSPLTVTSVTSTSAATDPSSSTVNRFSMPTRPSTRP